MSLIGSLTALLQGQLDGRERREIVNAAVLFVLAKAASADVSLRHVELESVRRFIETTTGASISDDDIRAVAKTEYFESRTLEEHLDVIARQTSVAERLHVIQALRDVLASDGEVTRREIEFYNEVAAALAMSAAEHAGIIATDSPPADDR